MTAQMRHGWIDLDDMRLETRTAGPPGNEAPMLVMIHEGLGCADLWGKLPAALAEATGCGVVAYSRAGYGNSSPKPLPWPAEFMHDEALKVLPRVLEAVGFRRGLLVGASDGASIAAIHAGSIADERVLGLALSAPHFIVEEATAAGARAAKVAYEQGDLKRKLERWHANVDNAFYGWNQAFADPAFKAAWGITELLEKITIPVQILQGELDQYGTPEQLAIAERACKGPVEATLLPGLGHSLYREVPELMCDRIAEFAGRVLARSGQVGGARP